MIPQSAKAYPFHVLTKIDNPTIYPYILSNDGDVEVINVGPCHGRSYVVAQRGQREYVVTKGNGLSYSTATFLNTGEMGEGTWGLLLRQDAIRDFNLGNETASLGVKTNRMEAVVELDYALTLPQGTTLNPVLLQYAVECPYRIEDAPFMSDDMIRKEVALWEQHNSHKFDERYLVAANVLINNLRVLHDNRILHNALTVGNFTWALELLDFELASSPSHPYTNEDYNRHVPDLFDRELLDVYRIIIYVAGCLKEKYSDKKIESLFEEYGFDLHKYQINS